MATRWTKRPWYCWFVRKPKHRVVWSKNEHFLADEAGWLESDEAKGYWHYESSHPDDSAPWKSATSLPPNTVYTWAFSDADTAFAFKMRFG